MKTKTLLFLLAILAYLPSPARAGIFDSKTKQGVSLYNGGKYSDALKNFVDAQIESPENTDLSYNLGDTYYKMKDYDQAIKNYLNSAANTKDISIEEKSYYNLGNCFYQQGKLQEAVAYYQKALQLDPNDKDAKQNLEFVREEIKRRLNQEKERQQQQKQQQKQGQQQKQSQTGKQDKNQDKNQGDKKEQAQQQAGDKKQDKDKDKSQAAQEQKKEAKSGDKKDQSQGQNSARATKEVSDEEAQRWLDSLTEDRQQFQKQPQGPHGPEASSGRDW